MFRHLLVVIDGRPKAFRAVLVGMRLAWCLGARVTVLFIVHTRRTTPALAWRTSREDLSRARSLFRRARRVGDTLGVGQAFRFAFGADIGMLIATAVATQACDMVILPPAADNTDEPSIRASVTADLLLCR